MLLLFWKCPFRSNSKGRLEASKSAYEHQDVEPPRSRTRRLLLRGVYSRNPSLGRIVSRARPGLSDGIRRNIKEYIKEHLVLIPFVVADWCVHGLNSFRLLVPSPSLMGVRTFCFRKILENWTSEITIYLYVLITGLFSWFVYFLFCWLLLIQYSYNI